MAKVGKQDKNVTRKMAKLKPDDTSRKAFEITKNTRPAFGMESCPNCTDLQATNDRLRTALEEVIGMDNVEYTLSDAQDTAIKALAPQEP